jgi:hypothetical protein
MRRLAKTEDMLISLGWGNSQRAKSLYARAIAHQAVVVQTLFLFEDLARAVLSAPSVGDVAKRGRLYLVVADADADSKSAAPGQRYCRDQRDERPMWPIGMKPRAVTIIIILTKFRLIQSRRRYRRFIPKKITSG